MTALDCGCITHTLGWPDQRNDWYPSIGKPRLMPQFFKVVAHMGRPWHQLISFVICIILLRWFLSLPEDWFKIRRQQGTMLQIMLLHLILVCRVWMLSGAQVSLLSHSPVVQQWHLSSAASGNVVLQSTSANHPEGAWFPNLQLDLCHFVGPLWSSMAIPWLGPWYYDVSTLLTGAPQPTPRTTSLSCSSTCSQEIVFFLLQCVGMKRSITVRCGVVKLQDRWLE